jgi:hypothetical protein
MIRIKVGATLHAEHCRASQALHRALEVHKLATLIPVVELVLKLEP